MIIGRLARWCGTAALAASFLSGGVAVAQTGPTTPSEPAAVVLYDQTTHQSVSGWTASSNFESSLSTFDSQAADDFVISGEIWTITKVTVSGLYDGPSGTTYVNSLLLQIYGDAGTSPDKPGSSRLLNVTIPAADINGLSTGLFVITLPSSVKLPPGHYWLSAQANKSYGSDNRQWAWRESTVQAFSESVWQQPGNGYGKNCLTWKPRVTVCHEPATNSQGKDLVFKLEGTKVTVASSLYLPVTYR